MRIIDISQSIHCDMLVYPGDPKYHSEKVSSFKGGDGYEVSRLIIGTHCGTHIDAPSHMSADDTTVDNMPLSAFYGPCRVITITSEVISEKMIHDADIREGERILLRTDPQGKYAHAGRFNPTVISLRAAQLFADKKVQLIGIDSPSIENVEICYGEVHRTLLSSGIALLEGLCLEGVDDGEYTISAFPLKLAGENGSPCRAVLIKNDC